MTSVKHVLDKKGHDVRFIHPGASVFDGRCHITGWHSQDFVVNMPIKLQRSPLDMSSALRRETGEVSDGISDDVGR